MIHDTRLPDDVEQGARGGPGFKTTIVTLSNGEEQRNLEWTIARGAWDIGYGIRDRATMEAVYAFFLARHGRAYGFRFKDWLDYQAVAETVGTTGNVLTRQLQKSYQDTVAGYVRSIVLPVAATLKVYIDNIETPSGWTLGANGLLTFDSDPGVNVKASFDFDLPARFDADAIPFSVINFNAVQALNIPIVELRSA